MQSNTGIIGHFENEKYAKDAGFDVQLTKKEYKTLQPMSRNQRKAWNKKLKKK